MQSGSDALNFSCVKLNERNIDNKCGLSHSPTVPSFCTPNADQLQTEDIYFWRFLGCGCKRWLWNPL